MSMKDNFNRRSTLRIRAAIAVAAGVICAAIVGPIPAMAQLQQVAPEHSRHFRRRYRPDRH